MSKHTHTHAYIQKFITTPKTKVGIDTTVQITLFWRTKYMHNKHIPFSEKEDFGGEVFRRRFVNPFCRRV